MRTRPLLPTASGARPGPAGDPASAISALPACPAGLASVGQAGGQAGVRVADGGREPHRVEAEPLGLGAGFDGAAWRRWWSPRLRRSRPAARQVSLCSSVVTIRLG